jgi:hypothetical protein
MEAIQPWINPQLWNEMKKLENARPNILDSKELMGDDTREHGFYVGEDGELHHPLIDAVRDREKKAQEGKPERDNPQFSQPSFRPLPTE